MCNLCHFSAIEPCLLPCGHSCCKSCVVVGATTCPVGDCKTPLDGMTRDTLPTNWIATQFQDEKPQQHITICQVCAEQEIQKEATHWCECCSTGSSDVEYYCEACDAAEHSSRNNRGHVRLPVKQMSSIFSFSSCRKHKLPEDSYCFDDEAFICHRCRDESHQTHRTKLVVDYQNSIRQDLKSTAAILRDDFFEKEEASLKIKRETKEIELKKLEESLLQMKEEIVTINENIEKTQKQAKKSKLASLALEKNIDQYPIRDLLDPQKVGLMKSRMNQTFKLVSRPSFFWQDSTILRGNTRGEEFIRLLDSFFPNLADVKLLYNPTRDGWTVQRFHQLCDGKPNTLVLVESGAFVFGGFNPLRWNEVVSGPAQKHKDAFLFSLNNPSRTAQGVKLPNTGGCSIYCDPNSGPTFGASDVFSLYVVPSSPFALFLPFSPPSRARSSPTCFDNKAPWTFFF